MFLKVSTSHHDNPVTINTSQIAFIIENEVFFSNGVKFNLLDDSSKELEESLYGPGDEAKPGASEHTTTLLNDLNKLCGGTRDAKPTTDRKARLKSRLKDFSEEELKIAAKNIGEDEFMQGENDRNKRFGTLDYLLRSAGNVNKWLEEQPKKPKSLF